MSPLEAALLSPDPMTAEQSLILQCIQEMELGVVHGGGASASSVGDHVTLTKHGVKPSPYLQFLADGFHELLKCRQVKRGRASCVCCSGTHCATAFLCSFCNGRTRTRTLNSKTIHRSPDVVRGCFVHKIIVRRLNSCKRIWSRRWRRCRTFVRAVVCGRPVHKSFKRPKRRSKNVWSLKASCWPMRLPSNSMRRRRLPTPQPRKGCGRVNVAIDRRRVVAAVDRVALDLPLGQDRTHRLAGT